MTICYVKPFSSDTGTSRTDGQTNKIAISISRVSMLTRDNDVMSILKMADLSHLGFLGSNNGFFEKPNYITTYRSSVDTIPLNCLSRFCILASTSKMADLRHLGF